MPLPVFTNDQIATQLISGYAISTGDTPHHFNVAPGGTLSVNVSLLPLEAQTLARAALAIWSEATGINFSEVFVDAAITFRDNEEGAFESDFYSGGFTTSATINVSAQWLVDNGTGINSYSYQTYLHEIGHALGLGHAGNYNGSAVYGTDNLYLNDSWQATVMSYFSQSDNTYINGTTAYIMTPMVADYLAIANMYGAQTAANLDDTVYGFNATAFNRIYHANIYNDVSYTVFDNHGVDTLDYSGFAQNQRINLNAESVSNVGGLIGNIVIARGTLIENAIGGSGADILIGNGADNLLAGGAGGDSLSGGGGTDTAGYAASAAGVSIFLGTGAASGGDAAGDTFSSIENITGSNFNDALYGTNFANVMTGNNGIDYVEGYGGVDIIAGGAGGDVLSGGSENDTLSGDADNDQLYGGTGNDSLTGGDGIDILNGDGGVDTLSGEFGDDYLYGGAENDTIFGADGNDNLYGGDGDDTLSAGLLTDILNGNAGNDIMNGDGGGDYLYGGLGNDAMNGGLENDVVSGENGDDLLNGDTGTDAVRGGGGNDTVNGGLDGDYLYGETGGDFLTGGLGNDVVYCGNDTGGFFDGSADTAIFSAAEGIDALYGFEAGSGADVMRLIGTGYANFAAVMANTYDFAGYSVIVTSASSQIYVYGVQIANYTAGDFLLA
jgi:serralysin